jgi:hypothetical protein
MSVDPLTALSVAGTIVQFVDFGTKLISRSKELYQSVDGALGVNKELEKIVEDLSKLLVKLQRPVRLKNTSSGNDLDEDALESLCTACRNVANEMLKRLEGLKVNGNNGRWKCFGKALKSAWSRHELETLRRRLLAFENALRTRVLVGLRYVSSNSSFLLR